ncbi:hypothetical protein BKA93DRAFT_258880 [Sparassis latifolia]
MAGSRLQKRPLSEFPNDDILAGEFWSMAWGQETFTPFEADVVRDGTLFANLDEPIPATCRVIKAHPFISEDLEYMVKRRGNMVVIGHPGIGKTIFLFYVLTYRLQRGLSTFYQESAHSVLYFHKSGVYSIPASQRPHSVDWESDDIWSLFDSNRTVKEPGELIGGKHSGWFLIEAASPHRERWSGWPKYKGFVDFFYMKPPSFAEIVMIRPHQKEYVGTEQDLYQFYQTYGPSIRYAFQYADPSLISAYQTDVAGTLEHLNYEGLLQDVLDANKLNMEKGSHDIFLVEPSSDNRREYIVSVVTDEIMKMVWEMHLRGEPQRIAEFATLFAGRPSSRCIAGWIVDTHVHPILLQAGTRLFHPMQGLVECVNVHYAYPDTTAVRSPDIEVQIPDLRHLFFSMNDPTTDFELNHFYQPKEKNNATFDALTVTQEEGQNYVTVYQVMLAKEYGVSEKGLRFLDKCLDLPKGTASIPKPRIRYVLVILQGEEVKSVFPRYWVEKWEGILDVYALEIEL